MKNALPILIVVVLGLGLIGGGAWYFLGNRNTTSDEEMAEDKQETTKELSVEEKPYVTLTPRTDGKELHLTISNLPSGVSIVDYELGYKTGSGVGEGVTGNVKLKGEDKIDRDLLLGSCSSGKCRYHEGVEEGTVTLRLRNSAGKLISKIQSAFHLQQADKELTLSSRDFSYSLAKVGKSSYYLTMDTMGLPADAPGKIEGGPVGIFSKDTNSAGTVDLNGSGDLYVWNGSKWVKVDGGKSPSFGTFVKVSSQ